MNRIPEAKPNQPNRRNRPDRRNQPDQPDQPKTKSFVRRKQRATTQPDCHWARQGGAGGCFVGARPARPTTAQTASRAWSAPPARGSSRGTAFPSKPRPGRPPSEMTPTSDPNGQRRRVGLPEARQR